MTPYYQDSLVTIYHGDCREWMPPADVIVTDPPYGVAFATPLGLVGKGNRRVFRGGKGVIVGDDSPFDPAHLIATGLPAVLFGANHYSDKVPVSGGWIVWDKTGGGRGPDNSFADVELAWTNITKTPSIFHHLWKGLVRDSEAGERVRHPTQKPVALMSWVVEHFTKPGVTVLDPYMGCGPVVVAAKSLGRRSIGIEIEERYCEVAAKRCSQEVLGLVS